MRDLAPPVPEPALSMEDMHHYVRQLCQCHKQGGQVIVRDANTVLVTDCATWPEHYTDRLKFRYPHATVQIYTSTASLSGFAVLVQNRPSSASAWWFAVLGVLLASVYYITRTMADALWPQLLLLRP